MKARLSEVLAVMCSMTILFFLSALHHRVNGLYVRLYALIDHLLSDPDSSNDLHLGTLDHE